MHFNPIIFTLYIYRRSIVDLKTEINWPPLLFPEVRPKQQRKKVTGQRMKDECSVVFGKSPIKGHIDFL